MISLVREIPHIIHAYTRDLSLGIYLHTYSQNIYTPSKNEYITYIKAGFFTDLNWNPLKSHIEICFWLAVFSHLGALKVSFSGELEISMIMKGLIYEPFGISKLAFGDMIIALGITIAGGLPSFRKFLTWF